MSEEIYRPSIGEDIPEIGEDGYKHFRKVLKFGDVIENGWASENNPNKFGIIVNPRAHSINCTDGRGRFWDLLFQAESKIKVHGSVLKDNYEDLIKALK